MNERQIWHQHLLFGPQLVFLECTCTRDTPVGVLIDVAGLLDELQYRA